MTHFRQTTGDDGAITVILKEVDKIVQYNIMLGTTKKVWMEKIDPKLSARSKQF